MPSHSLTMVWTLTISAAFLTINSLGIGRRNEIHNGWPLTFLVRSPYVEYFDGSVRRASLLHFFDNFNTSDVRTMPLIADVAVACMFIWGAARFVEMRWGKCRPQLTLRAGLALCTALCVFAATIRQWLVNVDVSFATVCYMGVFGFAMWGVFVSIVFTVFLLFQVANESNTEQRTAQDSLMNETKE